MDRLAEQDRAALLAALEWYRAVGVDLAVGEAPVDRFAAPPPAPRLPAARPLPAAPGPSAAPARQPAPTPTPVPVSDPGTAAALAGAADSLAALEASLAAFEGCTLKLRASRMVFADGNPEAGIMLVGEAPGSEEDRLGKPFVGRAGQLLDRMLAAIGLDRSSVYIANMVPWRPPGNRNPTPEELAACLPFLHRQVALVAPKILVTLGNVPTQALFETTTGITRMRGQWRTLSIGGHEMRALPTLHPAFLLRTPSAKQQVWRDLLSLRQAVIKENAKTG